MAIGTNLQEVTLNNAQILQLSGKKSSGPKQISGPQGLQGDVQKEYSILHVFMSVNYQ